MVWRRRIAEPMPLERRVAEPVEVVAARPVVVLVDDALRTTSRCSLVRRSEAIGVLHRVESAAHDLPAASHVLAIVDRIERESAHQELVPQRTVVDALLDVRSALRA
jgi:hypothetical protein